MKKPNPMQSVWPAGTGMQINEEQKAKANNLNQMQLIIG